MNSEQESTLYARWLAGDISETEEHQLRTSGEWTELEKIRAATDLLALPDYDMEAGYARFRKEKMQTQTKVRRLPTARILAIAAGVAILIIAGIFLLQTPDTKVFAQHGTNVTYQLPDQSEVILNDGSGIVFNEKKWEEERLVHLTGEAFFSVEKGSTFSVLTKNGKVTVLGTTFNVRAWGEGIRVECYEGRVRLNQGNIVEELTAGVAMEVNNNELEEIEILSNTQKPAWLSGKSEFLATPVHEVFAEIERQYNININIPVGLDLYFTGQIPHDDLEQALRNVCLPLELNYQINGERVEIEQR